jgi:hypothetical protein
MPALRATVAAGPRAQVDLAAAVAQGRVYRDGNGVDWVRRHPFDANGREAKRTRVNRAVVAALVDAGRIRLVGDRWEVCDVAE